MCARAIKDGEDKNGDAALEDIPCMTHTMTQTK